MQVNFNLINFTPKNKKQDYSTRPQNGGGLQSKDFSPVAYKDFNISFGERLFRTPENFYEQDFNEKNMPATLHKYIYETVDTNFKRTIPPAQAMKEAFGKLNYAKDLDTVKLLFPDEPLFKNLTSQPNKKSREGLLGMINLLKNDPEYKANNRTLFKNGQDDLGMYILKKIYLEGKTLKEINKDFARDVSVYYKSYDIRPQDYAAYGIRFPEKPFWKSFIATREDFPYVYIPRTTAERVVAGDRAKMNSTSEAPVAKKKREPLSFVQRKKMSEAMINWHANMTPEERTDWLNKMKVGREASVFHNYFGAIVTIAQDKVDHAGKMATFFEKVYGDPDYLTNEKDKVKQSQALNKFWKAHNQHRYNYSKAMTDVIETFDKAYGEDGESPEFKDLLALADSISLKNEENRKLRLEARLEAQRKAEEAKQTPKIQEKIEVLPNEPEKMTYDSVLASEASKHGGKIYKFKLSDGTEVSIVANLKEILSNRLDTELAYMPKSFVTKYKKFMLEHPKVTDEYMLSMFYRDDMDSFDVSEFTDDTRHDADDELKERMSKDLKDQFMTKEETDMIGMEVHKEFDQKNSKFVKAVDQALLELLSTLPLPDDAELMKLAKEKYDEYEEKGLISEKFDDEDKEEIVQMLVTTVIKDLKLMKTPIIGRLDTNALGDGIRVLGGGNPLSAEQSKFLEDRISAYRVPLSSSEVRKVTLSVINKMMDFDLSKTVPKNDKSIAYIYNTIIATIKKYPDAKASLSQKLQKKYITPDTPTMRCFIDPKVSKEVIDAKLYELIVDIIENDSEFFRLLASIDSGLMERHLKPFDPAMYESLMRMREISAFEYMSAKFK